MRLQFEEQLRTECPQFVRLRDPRLDSGLRIYEWGYNARLRFFVVLNLHPSEDAFTIEIAWTKNGKWPDVHVPMPQRLPLDAPSGEARFRIGMLWSPNPDYWWQVSPGPPIIGPNRTAMSPEALWQRITNPPSLPETLERVPIVVTEAIGKIKAFVIPYFEAVAIQMGGQD